MKHIKLFEDFKLNNNEGNIITPDDIIKCIKSSGVIYATIVKELPNNDPKKPLKPLSIDEDNSITVEYDNSEYEVDLENVEKIEF